MKSYTYRIGKGSDGGMEHVMFSQELFADSLGEAADMVRAMVRKRPVNDGEDTVQILDEEQTEQPVIWTHTAAEIRDN